MKSRKLIQRIVTLSLAVLLCISLVGGITPAARAEGESTGPYETVFVHGLLGWGYEDLVDSIIPYWGMTSGNMMDYLTRQGYAVKAASVGPISSAWDRCCELFAQLTGTKVDYGQAHAEKCTAQYSERGYDLTHGRYGRDYTGKALIDGWGPIYGDDGEFLGWNENKVNLVGHSFGGPTILRFLQLLAEGDAAEIAWGKQQAAEQGGDWHDYVSPLFWGDYEGEQLVNSITTLAGVLNGTTFISTCDDETAFLEDMILAMANLLGVTDIGAIYDFQLEQFGLTRIPCSDSRVIVSRLKQSGFLAGDDQAWYDLSIAGCNELKQGWTTYDSVYYFSYAGDKTYSSISGNRLPDLDMFALFMPFSIKIGRYVNRYEFVSNVDGTRYGSIDKSWLANDGMVNTISARYPLGAAHKDFDANNVESGIWQVYPDQDMDHLAFSGGMLNSRPLKTRNFYLQLMGNLAATY